MEKILLIDDQPEVLEMVAYVLREEGYYVVDARGGKEGLRRAREFRPDIILCDIMMPDLNGYDVIQAMRRDVDLSTTPFIFLTAKVLPEDRRQGMQLGADDYLTKPFDTEALLAAVRAQLDKYAKIRERFDQQLDLLRQGLSTILPHELRTPLTLIMAHASLLLESFDMLDKASVLESLRNIHESSERLYRLVENLLIYVELEGDETLRLEHPYTADVAAIATEAAQRRAEVYHRQSDLRVQVADGALKMHALHLRKMVEELVDNAFKFSDVGDPVAVTLDREEEAFLLTVTDRGRGLSEEQLQNIEAYVQFSRSRFEQQGSGLGLAIVKRLAALYHGTLAVESTPSKGSTLRVRIPDLWDPAS